MRTFAVYSTALVALLAAAPQARATDVAAAQPSVAAPAPVTARDPVLAALADRPAGAAVATLYAQQTAPLFTAADGLSAKGRAVTAVLTGANDYGLDAARYDVPPARVFSNATDQAAHEAAIAQAVIAYARDARGARISDPSKISTSFDMNPALPEPAAILQSLATADDAGAALLAFHPQHAGFKALQRAYATERAAKAPAERLHRLEVNLERWRWMPQDLGAFYVWNNVPEQLTRVVRGADVVHTERIVVGKVGHSTPIMSADMKYVMFHPSWGVPDGIKKNEVGPMLARASARSQTLFDSLGLGDSGGRASAALAKHQLRAYHNGREVNPDSIDWRTVDVRQFTFTQPPSSRNVLGVVKFRFPNKFDVYMHDTQDRHLFAHNVRAYSHGCMRVQNPVKFAAVLLGHDKGWSEEKVQSFVPGGRSSDITLSTPIPVHLTYFTASADAAGHVTLHGDLYGWDARVASALSGKPVSLAAAKVQAPAATAPRQTRTAAGATPRPTAAWSPWSGLSAN